MKRSKPKKPLDFIAYFESLPKEVQWELEDIQAESPLNRVDSVGRRPYGEVLRDVLDDKAL